MLLMCKKILLSLIVFFSVSVTSWGGERGYYIVFANLTDQENDPVLKNFYEYFNKEDKSNDSCLFEWVYIKQRPIGLTNEVIFAAINGDQQSLLKVKKLLKNYSDDMVNHFDGLIAYSHSEKKIVLTGIGIGRQPISHAKSTLTFSDSIKEKTIDRILCQAAEPFQETFSP